MIIVLLQPFPTLRGSLLENALCICRVECEYTHWSCHSSR